MKGEKGTMSSGYLFRKVAGWIEQATNGGEYPEGFLPSRRELAKRYRVSESTVQKALKYLTEQGVVRCTRGRPAEICSVSHENHSPSPAGSSVDYIAGEIENEILGGILKAGDRLPKTEYYVSVYRVSSHTVVAAYRILARKGIIHKHGRKHIVGAPLRTRPVGSEAGKSYVVLVVLVDSRTWLDLHQPRTVQFVNSFLNELEPRHIQMQPVYLDYPRAWEKTVNGPRAIISHAENLGSRYLGTLVPLRSIKLHPDAPLIRRLKSLNRPIVWFDSIDERNVHHPKDKTYYRCRFSEERAVHSAIETLAGMGHRFVGYSYEESIEWQDRRASMLETYARGYGIRVHRYAITRTQLRDRFETFGRLLMVFEKEGTPELSEKIVRFKSRLPDWEERLQAVRTGPETASDFEIFNQVCKRDLDFLKPYFEELATIFNIGIYGRHFMHMNDHEITAAVLPSDEYAKRPSECLQMLGFSIPERLSLLTFDNYDPRRIIPISSVDFGFGPLGYWAFHAIAGDMTLPVDRHRTIWAQPFVNDKGSLAPPRDCELLTTKSRDLLKRVAELSMR